MSIEYRDFTEMVNPDPARPGILYRQALETIRTAYKAGRISETIYTVRMAWLFSEFQAAPNASKQIVVCKAAIELCKE